MNYKLSNYVVFTDVINETDDPVLQKKIAFSTRTGTALIIGDQSLTKVQAKQFSELDEKQLESLIQAEIIVPDFEDEISTILGDFKLCQNDRKVLSYTLAPSADCQLGCDYCGQEHRKTSMSEEQAEKLVAHVRGKLENDDYKALSITWYGAEPLMGYTALQFISTKFLELADEFGIQYFADMITNGLSLKPNVFNNLVKNHKVRFYQITIDGVKETHDNSRMTKQNNPTFDLIMRNIEANVNEPVYREEDCTFLIRINVHKKNWQEVDTLLDLVHEKGLHKDIMFDFAPIHDWGTNGAHDSIGIDINKFADLEIGWMLKMKKMGFKESEALPDRSYGTCMVTHPEAEMIDADGEISYCWEVPYTPTLENNPDLIIGNLSNEKVYREGRENAPMRQWYSDIADGTYTGECKTCAFLPTCGGGCPIHWFNNAPACPTYKYNIEDRLVLQYLSGKLDFAKEEKEETAISN